jgi:hypothetical protein
VREYDCRNRLFAQVFARKRHRGGRAFPTGQTIQPDLPSISVMLATSKPRNW